MAGNGSGKDDGFRGHLGSVLAAPGQDSSSPLANPARSGLLTTSPPGQVSWPLAHSQRRPASPAPRPSTVRMSSSGQGSARAAEETTVPGQATAAPEVTGMAPGAEAQAVAVHQAPVTTAPQAGGDIDAAVVSGQALVVFDGPGTGQLTMPSGQVVRVRQRPGLGVNVARSPSPTTAWLGAIPPPGPGQLQVITKAPPPGRGQSPLTAPAALPPPPKASSTQAAASPAAVGQAAPAPQAAGPQDGQAAPAAGPQAGKAAQPAGGQAPGQATGQAGQAASAPTLKAPPPGQAYAHPQGTPGQSAAPPPGQSAGTPPPGQSAGTPSPPAPPPTATPVGQAGGTQPGPGRQAGGQGGARARSRSAPAQPHASTAAQVLGGGGGGSYGQAGGGGGARFIPPYGQAPVTGAGWAQTGADTELALPGGAMWRQRQEQAGAPGQGYQVNLEYFENFLVDRSAARPNADFPHRGQALHASDDEPLISGRLVYNLRDHIGQLQRELGHLDAMLLSAFYGQARMPALRRALHTVSLALRPVLQECWVILGTWFSYMGNFTLDDYTTQVNFHALSGHDFDTVWTQ